MKQRLAPEKASTFADVVFPSKCAFCRKVIEPDYLDICDACALKLQAPPQKRRGEFYNVCVSALPYDEMTQRAVCYMKIAGKPGGLTTFGRLIAAQIRQQLDGKYDVITWVPVSYIRRVLRGFDQGELLAQAAAEALNMPYGRLLYKWRQNRTQSSLPNAAKRRSNVLNVFKPFRKKEIVGKRILLIDDVITTGATLTECSRVLLTAGASQVVCATLAATQKK